MSLSKKLEKINVSRIKLLFKDSTTWYNIFIVKFEKMKKSWYRELFRDVPMYRLKEADGLCD